MYAGISYAAAQLEQDTARSVIAAVTEEALPVRRSWRRRLLVAGVAAVGTAAVLTVKKVSTPCAGGLQMDRDSFVSLAAVDAQEMSSLINTAGNGDAVGEWLLLANQARNDATDAEKGSLATAQEAVVKAMQVKDFTEAKELVDKVMARSLQQTHDKRKDLKSFMLSKARSLKGRRRHQGPGQSATIAECVFNVEQAVAQVAQLAANIADSAKTCGDFKIDWKGTPGKVCVMNLAGIGYSMATIAATLSVAAENCASTLLPNFNALCVGGVAGAVGQISQLASAAALTSAACTPDQSESPGAVPHNWGTTPGAHFFETANSTQARRLLFGGGRGSMSTQCFVDTTSASWWLAQAALAINAAANPNNFASCNIMPSFKGTKPLHKLHQYQQGVCAADALGAINGFLQTIMYLQLSVVHCPDVLNLPALCGAGIDGMISAIAGTGAGAIGGWFNCWDAQGLQFKDGKLQVNKKLAKIHQAGMLTKINGLRQEGNMGRRLSTEDADEELTVLQSKFATPEDVWRSIGIDLNDKDADFRQAPAAAVKPKNLVRLVEDPQAASAGLFEMCS